MPFDSFTQMEDIGRVVQRFPAFGQMGLHDERARLNPWAEFVPQERTVHEAQGGVRLGVDGEMRVKVGGIIAPDAQGTAALGRPGFCPPQCRGTMQRPGRQRGTSGQAGFE